MTVLQQLSLTHLQGIRHSHHRTRAAVTAAQWRLRTALHWMARCLHNSLDELRTRSVATTLLQWVVIDYLSITNNETSCWNKANYRYVPPGNPYRHYYVTVYRPDTSRQEVCTHSNGQITLHWRPLLNASQVNDGDRQTDGNVIA